jgi:hypothetical protein
MHVTDGHDTALSFMQSETKPKAVIKIHEINVVFSPQKVHPHGMQISFMKDGLTRNIFVYAEDPKSIVDWYTAIRAAKLHSLTVAFPTIAPHELAEHLTRDFSLEGYLHKTGPRVGDAYRRRYFLLDDRKLMYSNDPMVSSTLFVPLILLTSVSCMHAGSASEGGDIFR